MSGNDSNPYYLNACPDRGIKHASRYDAALVDSLADKFPQRSVPLYLGHTNETLRDDSFDSSFCLTVSLPSRIVIGPSIQCDILHPQELLPYPFTSSNDRLSCDGLLDLVM